MLKKLALLAPASILANPSREAASLVGRSSGSSGPAANSGNGSAGAAVMEPPPAPYNYGAEQRGFSRDLHLLTPPIALALFHPHNHFHRCKGPAGGRPPAGSGSPSKLYIFLAGAGARLQIWEGGGSPGQKLDR